MRQITIAFRSSKVATLVALAMVGIYGLTEFGEHSSYTAQAKLSPKSVAFEAADAASALKTAALVPTPAFRPDGLPQLAQPEQFTVVSLQQGLNDISFSLLGIRDGKEVPRYFVNELPVDILDLASVKDRKEIFISVVLPLILKANEEIAKDRETLKKLISAKQQGSSWGTSEMIWLDALAKRYYGDATDLEDLLLRVDQIPVSLALAQSIEESGWGTSRFAHEGNALFGQRVWAAGNGLVPHERAEGEAYEVKAFAELLQSVRDYTLNLNRHPAYADFRFERARLSDEIGYVDGETLARSLISYSERGEHYVEALQMLIRVNGLASYETARLSPKRVAQLSSSKLSNN